MLLSWITLLRSEDVSMTQHLEGHAICANAELQTVLTVDIVMAFSMKLCALLASYQQQEACAWSHVAESICSRSHAQRDLALCCDGAYTSDLADAPHQLCLAAVLRLSPRLYRATACLC